MHVTNVRQVTAAETAIFVREICPYLYPMVLNVRDSNVRSPITGIIPRERAPVICVMNRRIQNERLESRRALSRACFEHPSARIGSIQTHGINVASPVCVPVGRELKVATMRSRCCGHVRRALKP